MSTIEVRDVQRKRLARGEMLGSADYTEAVRRQLAASGENIPEPEVKLSMSRTIKNFQNRRKNARTDPMEYRTKPTRT